MAAPLASYPRQPQPPVAGRPVSGSGLASRVQGNRSPSSPSPRTSDVLVQHAAGLWDSPTQELDAAWIARLAA